MMMNKTQNMPCFRSLHPSRTDGRGKRMPVKICRQRRSTQANPGEGSAALMEILRSTHYADTALVQTAVEKADMKGRKN